MLQIFNGALLVPTVCILSWCICILGCILYNIQGSHCYLNIFWQFYCTTLCIAQYVHHSCELRQCYIGLGLSAVHFHIADYSTLWVSDSFIPFCVKIIIGTINLTKWCKNCQVSFEWYFAVPCETECLHVSQPMPVMSHKPKHHHYLLVAFFTEKSAYE